MEVSGQLHGPAALALRREPLVPTGHETGWASEPDWMRWRREYLDAWMQKYEVLCSQVMVFLLIWFSS